MVCGPARLGNPAGVDLGQGERERPVRIGQLGLPWRWLKTGKVAVARSKNKCGLALLRLSELADELGIQDLVR